VSILEDSSNPRVRPVIGLDGRVSTASPVQDSRPDFSPIDGVQQGVQDVVDRTFDPFVHQSFAPESIGEEALLQQGRWVDDTIFFPRRFLRALVRSSLRHVVGRDRAHEH